MPTPAVTVPQALAWRLRRHGLLAPGSATAEDVVGGLVAVAAQADVDLAVRTRQAAPAEGEVAAALADGRLIRTFTFRGSVHVMTPDDAAVHLAVRGSGRQWELRSWREHYGLQPEDWPAFRATVREVLDDGPLTHDELVATLTARPAYRHLGPAVEGGAWALLKALAWQGDLCLGPTRDRRTTLQALAHVPRWPGIPELDDAGPRAVEAYVRAYGPATPDGLQYWLGSGLSAGRRLARWTADVADRLATVQVGGRDAFVLREDVDDLLATEPTGAVRLLPGYDQWVLGPGTADRDVVPPAWRTAATRGTPLVVAGGVVAGTWTERDGDLTVRWAPEGQSARSALDEGVDRLSGGLGRPLRVTVEAG
ncbi:DNA glycosylase AlkZ-like family protein [Cellulomonas dongxiuzhuiae]|uniref:Winged helix DNA-binding domain-containing protein n=1 Tax=Cellulomonas dongxiuzhuiae TaxID=2819979 RepID=A0ABX8GK10_9CELL|nr:crosslink repair DNA glycosylase YcaQ family protein [Cellulomonas dongxiuzhuiae]MBO3095291.1 winged helix DNA-binding domain-containing protein [Cellulomonas dongxiuzhuiae]QWC16285.1 winged helix DNA-binding domain-containing protein [Cellulomonas dongxiuzhuiae]